MRSWTYIFSDALSFTNFTHIYNDKNLQLILKYFKTDEFVKYDYNDCLRLEFIIFNLIASLFNAYITVNKISYEFWFDNKDDVNESNRIREICVILNYNSNRVSKLVESIYKVQAAYKSIFVCSVNFNFDVYISNFF